MIVAYSCGFVTSTVELLEDECEDLRGFLVCEYVEVHGQELGIGVSGMSKEIWIRSLWMSIEDSFPIP